MTQEVKSTVQNDTMNLQSVIGLYGYVYDPRIMGTSWFVVREKDNYIANFSQYRDRVSNGDKIFIVAGSQDGVSAKLIEITSVEEKTGKIIKRVNINYNDPIELSEEDFGNVYEDLTNLLISFRDVYKSCFL